VGLYKCVSGTYTSVAGGGGNLAYAGDRLVVQMNGTAISVLLNGVQIISYTDGSSFNTTATQHGIIVE
jgi:hypothetical protein